MKRLTSTRLLASWCIPFIATSTAAAQGRAQARARGPHGLSAHLEKFIVEKTFDDALRELALQIRSDLVIGFEPAARSEGAAPTIRVAMETGTGRDALALMCAADKRYAYSEAQAGVVNVRAVQQPFVPTGLGGYVKWSAFP